MTIFNQLINLNYFFNFQFGLRYVKTMSCSGNHLGCPIATKRTHFVEKQQKNIPTKFTDYSQIQWFQIRII